MIFYGLNVAAFKIPFPMLGDIWEDVRDECYALEHCFMPHNMQTGKTIWETAAIKSPLGNWRLTDPAFYRHLPEMATHSSPTLEARKKYMEQWAYTELAAHCPKTTTLCQAFEDVGAFMNGARFLKMRPDSFIKYHWDNNPHKEFRVTIGLDGMKDEEFVINNGLNKFTTIPMKEGEAWFVDISLGHSVHNTSTAARYRLGMQFYGPTSDWLLDLFAESNHVIFADQLRLNCPFQDGPI